MAGRLWYARVTLNPEVLRSFGPRDAGRDGPSESFDTFLSWFAPEGVASSRIVRLHVHHANTDGAMRLTIYGREMVDGVDA